VYLTAEGVAQSQLGISPTAEILKVILSGLKILGAGISSVLTQMLEQVIQGKPPSPPESEAEKKTPETATPEEPMGPPPPPPNTGEVGPFMTPEMFRSRQTMRP
jgi:type IV secretory pathway VirB10-like protein